ncbi:hypothetical protein V8F33_010666 [Rhypophila sp. PSN 637]
MIKSTATTTSKRHETTIGKNLQDKTTPDSGADTVKAVIELWYHPREPFPDLSSSDARPAIVKIYSDCLSLLDYLRSVVSADQNRNSPGNRTKTYVIREIARVSRVAGRQVCRITGQARVSLGGSPYRTASLGAAGAQGPSSSRLPSYCPRRDRGNRGGGGYDEGYGKNKIPIFTDSENSQDRLLKGIDMYAVGKQKQQQYYLFHTLPVVKAIVWQSYGLRDVTGAVTRPQNYNLLNSPPADLVNMLQEHPGNYLSQGGTNKR